MDIATSAMIAGGLGATGVIVAAFLNHRSINDERALALREVELRDRVTDPETRAYLDSLINLRARTWAEPALRNRRQRYVSFTIVGAATMVLGEFAVLLAIQTMVGASMRAPAWGIGVGVFGFLVGLVGVVIGVRERSILRKHSKRVLDAARNRSREAQQAPREDRSTWERIVGARADG